MESVFNFNKPKTVIQWLVFIAAIGITCTSPAGTRAFLRELSKYIDQNLNQRTNKQNREGINCFSSRELSQALYYLKKRKIIEIKETKGGALIVLSEKGRKRKFQYDFNSLKISPSKVWDKKWRFLMFDIPETDRAAREIFRSKLRNLGFVFFQKSVWLYPYPCENEIDFITEYLRIAFYVTLLTVQIDKDQPLREQFKL